MLLWMHPSFNDYEFQQAKTLAELYYFIFITILLCIDSL
jgi:hypothetical protein